MQWQIQDFPEVGRQPSRAGEGAKIRFYQIFQTKLHEIERIGPRGEASKILLCRSGTVYWIYLLQGTVKP